MIEATNVVPFPKPKPQYDFVTVAVDTSSPLEEGDLVAWQFINKDGSYSAYYSTTGSRQKVAMAMAAL